ncbi:MAG: LysR family transcriptional regulator [Sneathiella sp.]
MRLKLRQLQYYVAVFEEGSFTAAAHRLNATQSGVSMQIKDLEEILDATLFDRVAKGIIPTKIGHRTYSRAVQILHEVHALKEDVSVQKKQLSGTVRLGVMPTFARSILAPVLEQFLAENPLVDVEIVEAYSSVLTQKVNSGKLDFSVVPADEFAPGIKSSYLATDIEVLVRKAENDAHHLQPITLSDLHELKLVLPLKSNSRRTKIDAQLQSFDITLAGLIECDSMMTTLDLVQRGYWSSILPASLCLQNLVFDGLEVRPLQNPTLNTDYHLIQPVSKPIEEATSILIRQLETAIKSSVAKLQLALRQ